MKGIRKIIALIIIALIGIGLFIFQPFSTEPPSPNVKVGYVHIPTTQGSYCWNGLISQQCVDKIYGSTLEMAAEHKPTVVSPNKEVSIKFRKSPLEGTMEVTQLDDQNNSQMITVKNGKIKVPNEKGIYVYRVTASWAKGSGNYVFSIEVK